MNLFNTNLFQVHLRSKFPSWSTEGGGGLDYEEYHDENHDDSFGLIPHTGNVDFDGIVGSAGHAGNIEFQGRSPIDFDFNPGVSGGGGHMAATSMGTAAHRAMSAPSGSIPRLILEPFPSFVLKSALFNG